MKPITQTLGGEVTEGAAFDLETSSYRIEVAMAAQTDESPFAEFGMQESHDNGATWKTAQQHTDVGAAPIPRLIQADEEVAEAFSLTARLASGLKYRFTASSTTTVKITISKA